MKYLLLIILVAFSTSVFSEKIEYEIYELASGKLIGSGVKNYSKEDVILKPYKSQGIEIVEKYVELEQGFKIGARIFSRAEITGFGLVAQLSDGDFSWEWYNKKNGTKFQKLQGNKGIVVIRVSGFPVVEFLEEVKFLDDARLSFSHGGPGSPESHDIIIKKGSILKFD